MKSIRFRVDLADNGYVLTVSGGIANGGRDETLIAADPDAVLDLVRQRLPNHQPTHEELYRQMERNRG